MAHAVEVITTYEDHAGKESTNTAYVANGLSLAQYAEGLQGLAQLVDAVVGVVMKGLTFCVSVDLSGLTGNIALSTSDVEDVGAFQFLTSDSRPVNINIPGITDTLTPTGSDNIDQTDVDVAAFISAVTDGILTTGGTIGPSDVNEDDTVAIVYAREEVRNSGSGG